MENTLTFELEADEVEVFLQDVNEHLQAMESGILSLERSGDEETLNAVFRAAHTLKAVAGAVGHQHMAELTHTMETLFDAMRQATLTPAPDMTDELLAAVDVLKALRDEVVTCQPSGIDTAPILARLRALISRGADSELSAPAERAEGMLSPEQAAYLQELARSGYAILHINVTLCQDTFAQAARLLQATMAMAEAGHIIAQNPSEEDLLDDRQEGRLWVVLATQAEPDAIKERLADVTDVAEFQVQAYPLAPAAPPPPKENNNAAPSVQREANHELDKTVRISVERLDILMDLVGEMVTNRTRLAQIKEMLRAQYGKSENVGALDETIGDIGQIIDRLQDEVMRARMLPISQLFDKFPRTVRDLARTADKQVNLVIAGEATELDRSIIEAIGDPLIHLLRNAIDHGLELPQVRQAAGKPPAGTVRLTAEHAEGQIIVTVQDDGQGIDPAKIRQAAVRHGVMSEEEAAYLSDNEAVALIFRPGMSTAERVTGTSGRGVGLDVVRTNINRIGGSVVVDSAPGRGTSFRITLPLTLAIVQTMLVDLGGDVYAIPLTSIIESLYLSDVTVSGVKGTPAIRWRNEVLPLLHLAQFFGRQAPRPDSKPAIVAVAWGKLQAGLVVDKIIGKQEIVIKPFGPIIGNVPGLAGCTILGNGHIALIVDVPGLVNTAAHGRSQTARA